MARFFFRVDLAQWVNRPFLRGEGRKVRRRNARVPFDPCGSPELGCFIRTPVDKFTRGIRCTPPPASINYLPRDDRDIIIRGCNKKTGSCLVCRRYLAIIRVRKVHRGEKDIPLAKTKTVRRKRVNQTRGRGGERRRRERTTSAQRKKDGREEEGEMEEERGEEKIEGETGRRCSGRRSGETRPPVENGVGQMLRRLAQS